ncbi:uncharacterized protein Sara isoform X3 [Chelonus insularis]|uniref:uncharacterized protein Sara isoform X3 n=1 Tax=Chelonus insularis TaxID=460826 RepID=UPI00158C3B08|nr:uncharacterized protein LOC118067284 isoform X3 [Chelonus insularis]
MEKFAVDLDKVLDEFEFNEDCAEQVATVGESVSHVSTEVIQSQMCPSTKILNQPVISSNSSVHKENDHILTEGKMMNIQQINTDDKNVYQPKERITETLDIRKADVIHGNGESVNEFNKRGYQLDDKVQQKRAVDFCESEPVSLTIHNDISQKLVQKRKNDNTMLKNQNSYDKKLNQPNIKPSVSNVFNSLNEYINASSGNMERIDCSVDRNECKSSRSVIDKQINNTLVKDSKVNETNDKKTIVDSQIKKSINTSLPEYQNILLPIKSESSSDKKLEVNTEDPSTASNINQTNKKSPQTQQNKLSEAKSVVDSSQHIYENIHIGTNISNNQENYVPAEKLKSTDVSRSASQEETKHVYENVDFNQQANKETVYECIYIGKTNELPETTTELEIAAKRLNEQFTVSMKSSEMETTGINPTKLVFQNVNIKPPQVEHKPVGFSTIDDLSEEELNEYLAKLEAEERAKEEVAVYENVSIPGSSTSSYINTNDGALRRVMSSQHDDEDANEAPIFESVTIGELPCVSEEKLQEKAKKFPVIDYSKSGTSSESGDFLEKKDVEKFHEPAKTISEVKEKKIKQTGETAKKSSNDALENAVQFAAVQDANKQANLQLTQSGSDNCNQSSPRDANASSKNNESDDKNNADNFETSGTVSSIEKSTELPQGIAIKSQENPNDSNQGQNISDSLNVNNNTNSVEQLSEIPTMVDDKKHTTEALETPTDAIESLNSEEDFERPSRPQTLNIVSPVKMDSHSTIGLPGATPSTQDQPPVTEDPVVRERDPSPDASDSSSMEFGIILGKQPPFWVPDSEAPNCMLCDARFTVIKRRHHCRACGKVLCSKCCNLKYKLEYQKNVESRVCSTCYLQLIRTESEHGSGDWSSDYANNASASINSPQGRQPNPNNPMEYCSTIPPLQQLAGGLPSPPTVMVPVGVLKREGSTKQRAEGQKSVMFSDELDTSWDLKPPYRKIGNKRIPSPGSQSTSATKRQNLPPLDLHTNSYIPQDANMLPPTVTIHKGQISYHEVVDQAELFQSLKNECEPPVMFAINRNLYAYVKITNLNCCVNRICWNVTSRGLACVGQDEVILLVETLPEETQIPKDLLIHINQIYTEAIKGNTVTELGVSIHQGGNLLGSREHAGFLFIRQTFQCLQKIVLPPAPFLVGLLVHRWETPWAKIFPLRLVLRLGAEYRYYPCPLVSVRFRDAVYFEIGHTIMKVLADFRNYAYTLPSVRGLIIHMQDRTTDVLFPRNRYDQVIKGLNNSNDHVLAFAANFSIHADSHLVCIQTNTGDESSYQTQAINIHNKPRKVTGASFVVINGALKSSVGLSAKSSIVEDGLMVQIMPEKMEALKAALKNMQDFSIGCGRQGASEPDETVNIKWVENDVQFNLGVKSPIDGKPMDGIPSIRVHNGTDYMGTSRFIRWTEVFIIKSDDHPNGVHDPVDINKLSESIARATCAALVKLLDLLATAGLTKLAVRTTIHTDNVGYEAGSENTRLPPIYMNSLDNELIPVLHKAAQSSQEINVVLELIFHVLDD